MFNVGNIQKSDTNEVIAETIKEKSEVSNASYNTSDVGGEAVSRVALNNKNSAFFAKNTTQYYVFIEGVAGVLAKWFRPAAKRSMGYMTQKRDEHGNFTKKS